MMWTRCTSSMMVMCDTHLQEAAVIPRTKNPSHNMIHLMIGRTREILGWSWRFHRLLIAAYVVLMFDVSLDILQEYRLHISHIPMLFCSDHDDFDDTRHRPASKKQQQPSKGEPVEDVLRDEPSSYNWAEETAAADETEVSPRKDTGRREEKIKKPQVKQEEPAHQKEAPEEDQDDQVPEPHWNQQSQSHPFPQYNRGSYRGQQGHDQGKMSKYFLVLVLFIMPSTSGYRNA